MSIPDGTSTANTWYRVRILAKGANVTVWRGEGDDGPMERVLSTTSAPTMTPASMWFISGANAAFAYDDIEVVADGWTSDTTFAVNSGNEMTSSTFGGVTTTYGYDAWGNMTTKARGTYTAAYAWHYGGKLTGVTSTFPGEGAVTYAYGGDLKRRQRDDGTTVTWYNYDLDWNLLNEEDNTGTLTTTFIHAPQGAVGPVLADVAGGSPASGAYRYYTLDHLGSTSGLYDGAKAKVAALAYTPYGASYADVGPGPLPRYTGHLWDGAAGLHLAPYRAYAPTLARWLSRDPLGMVDGPNVYGYVGEQSTTHGTGIRAKAIPNSYHPPCRCPGESVEACMNARMKQAVFLCETVCDKLFDEGSLAHALCMSACNSRLDPICWGSALDCGNECKGPALDDCKKLGYRSKLGIWNGSRR